MTLRTKERQRVIKALISTILSLDMKSSDLKQLRNDIAQGDIMHEISFLIGMLNDHFESFANQDDSAMESELVEEIINFVQRKRLSKSQFTSLLRDITRDQLNINADNKNTIRDITETFVHFAEPTQILELRSLMSDTKSDPYLQGILKRMM